MHRPFRTFSFAHPDFDDGLPGLELQPSGALQMTDGDATVRQAVLLLLTTSPGERVMLPTYGCELNRLMFQPNDDTTAGLAIHYVRKALTRWEPRVEILKLDAGRSAEDPSRLDISLHYRVRPTSNSGGSSSACSSCIRTSDGAQIHQSRRPPLPGPRRRRDRTRAPIVPDVD
jgi:phage baseplate assembly protein W